MNPQLPLKISIACNLVLVGVIAGQFFPARVPDLGIAAPVSSRIDSERLAADTAGRPQREASFPSGGPATDAGAGWSGSRRPQEGVRASAPEPRSYPSDFARSAAPSSLPLRTDSGSPSLAAANSSTQTPARVTGRMLGVVPVSSAVGAIGASAAIGDLANKVDPSSPGNSIVAGSQRVGVEGYSARDEADGSLDLVAAPGAGTKQTPPKLKTTRATLTKGGYSYEDELFRAKWGWAAFEQAQKLAKEVNP